MAVLDTIKDAVTPESKENKKKRQEQERNIPEPPTEEAIEAGRVQPNPQTDGMTFEEQQKLGEEQQKSDEQRKEVLKAILASNEGYIVRNEQNADVVDQLAVDQAVVVNNVQSGPGGTQVEERVWITNKGYELSR